MTDPNVPTTSAPEPDPTVDRWWWVAPMSASLLMVPLGFFGFLFGEASVMATDPCNPGDCHALYQAIHHIHLVYLYCWLPLCASWCLPHGRRFFGLRLLLAALTPAGIGLEFLMLMSLPAPTFS
jgi:hypothetical protein